MGLSLPPDFRELLESLNANGVKYLLVGGYAVGHYGHSRSTNDIDIFVSPDEGNAKNLVTCLTKFGFDGGELNVELFTKQGSLVVMGVEPLAVDILNYLSGVTFDSAYSNREIVTDSDLEISVIGLDDLIKNKIASGRHKDLADAEYLKRVNKES
ncbi:MAG: nucleotidyltransferase [Pyrinomonadaceae bacterium]